MQTVRLSDYTLQDIEHGLCQSVRDESHDDHLSENDRLTVLDRGALQPLHE